MTTYIILSRFSPEAFDDPKKFKELASDVSAKIKKTVPGYNLEEQLRHLGTFRCGRPRGSRRPKTDRKSSDDYPRLRPFDDRNTGGHTVEGVLGYAVKPRRTTPATVATKLGIDLSSRKEGELFKWFLACLLFGKPIQQEIAERVCPSNACRSAKCR